MHNSIEIIRESDYCISCGACTHICPFENIKMDYDKKRGKYDATVLDKTICNKCSGEKNCLAVCPSYSVQYDKLTRATENSHLGRIERIVNGYSMDEKLRFESSSGGFIRECCKTLLDAQDIDGIITLTHKGGLEYEPDIIKDISKTANSVYHNINFQNSFELIKKSEGRFLIIGLPCHIASINLLLNKTRFKKHREKVYGFIALMCGYTFDRKNLEMFARFKNRDLYNITYREKGRFRKTRLYDTPQSSILFDVFKPKDVYERLENLIFFDQYLPQTYCLYCIDHMGYFADLTVGDAWQERYASDNIGTNIIISRTEKGEEILEKMDTFFFEEGYLEEIEKSQNIYAKSKLGYAMSIQNPQNKKFLPKHDLLQNNFDKKELAFSIDKKGIFKMNTVKNLIRGEHFFLAKLLYGVINWRMFYVYYQRKIEKLVGVRS